MAIPRNLPTFARIAILILAGSGLVQAGVPLGSFGIHAGGALRGGFRGGFHGGFRGAGPVRLGIYGGIRGGGMVRALPMGCVSYRFGGAPWFYGGGIWYRPWGLGYAPFYPPVGLCLAALPFGYMTYYYSGVPYYYYQDVYYTDAPSGGYMVTEPPVAEPEYAQPSRPAPASDPAADALLIIPKQGQDEKKMQADRQNAKAYAVDESGYDPARADASDPGTPRARRAYLRAMKAYLEERGYSVK
jgi:hypothetical protein